MPGDTITPRVLAFDSAAAALQAGKTDGPEFALACEAVAFQVEAQAPAGQAPRAPRFSMVAYRGGPMMLGGNDAEGKPVWPNPVVVDLQGLQLAAEKIPARLQHDRRRTVGHMDHVEVHGTELHASGVLSFETQDAKAIASSARNGFPWQASMGAAPLEVERVPRGRTAQANGRTFDGPVDIVRRSVLGEISFVDIGADNTTSASIAAQARGSQEKAMAGEKTDAPTQGETKEGQQAHGTGTHMKQDPPKLGIEAGSTQPGRVVTAIREENERKKQITALVEAAAEAVGTDAEALEEIERIGNDAVTQSWSVDKTENKILRAQMLAQERGSRASAPAIHSRSAAQVNDQALTAALLLSCGMKDEVLAKDRDIGERAVEVAWKRRGSGLHGLLAHALKAEGVDAPHGGDALFRAVVSHSIKAGFSTVNLAGILGAAGNKLLLQAFTSVDATYPLIAQLVDVTNFNTWTSYRLNDVGAFSKVSSSGELRSGRLEQDSYTNQLDTRGQMLTLTRQQIVNDDLNAFQSLYAQMGRKAVLALEKALYALVMEGSDVFYTSARGNRLTSTAFTLANLGAAEAAMIAQLDGDGEPIYASPTTVIVPPALKATADTVYSSATVIGGSSNVPQDNAFRGRFRPVSSPYLSLSTMTGSSATTWYMAANPDLLPAWQVAFLSGRRQPTVETADAAFNTLGMQMRCYFDFGVAQADYRGAIKATA